MLLTEQAARLQGGDWAPFFAAECAKPYFAALDAFVTEAAAHTTVYPAAREYLCCLCRLPRRGHPRGDPGAGPLPRAGAGHGAVFLGARCLQGTAQPAQYF